MIVEDEMDLKGAFEVFGIIQCSSLSLLYKETVAISTHSDRNIGNDIIYQSCKEQVH